MPINDSDYPVLDSVAGRWSPYRFHPRPVPDDQLLSCLEAARWAASSFNDQPWSWIVARRQDQSEFQQLLSCLLPANQTWAANAGALLLTVSRSTFAYNGKPNRVALHDLGQAAAQLALQATQLGLQVHQMAGVNLSQARGLYRIPDGFEPQTAIAIGYPDQSEPTDDLAKQLQERQSGPRQRKPLSEQVFAGMWGDQANFVP